MEKKIEAIDKIIKRMVEISDSRLCKQLNANWVMLRNSLLTPPADVQEQIEAYIKKNEADGIGPELRDAIHFAMNLAGASSLQAENERLREILKKVAHYNDGKKPYDYHKRTDQEQAKNDSFDDWQNIRTEINEALNKQ